MFPPPPPSPPQKEITQDVISLANNAPPKVPFCPGGELGPREDNSLSHPLAIFIRARQRRTGRVCTWKRVGIGPWYNW